MTLGSFLQPFVDLWNNISSMLSTFWSWLNTPFNIATDSDFLNFWIAPFINVLDGNTPLQMFVSASIISVVAISLIKFFNIFS